MPGPSPARPAARPRRPRVGYVVTAALVAAGALTSLAAAADEVLLRDADLQPFTVTYTVGNNLVSAGKATLTFERQAEGDAGDLWSYRLATRPTGVFKLTGKGNIEETSLVEFEAVDGGYRLLPRSYTYRQDDEKRRAVDATFDRDAGELVWQRRGKEGSYPLDQPILDRLSVTLAVMSALRQGSEQTAFTVFDSAKLKDVVFEQEAVEDLETSLGTLETVRVLRSNASGSSRTTLTWFAPSLDFVPVKIEQYKRDELVARLTLEKLSNATTEIEERLIEPEAPVADD